MAMYLGKAYTKRELLRYAGNMEKIAGIQTSRIDGGKGDSIRKHHVLAGELAFSVMENRCMDVLDLSYKGISLNFLSKCGPVHAGLAEKEEMNFLRSIAGGLLYTCGTGNVGPAFRRQDGEEHFHGRLRFEPASKVSLAADWEGDAYRLSLRGEMRETGLFQSNIALRRSIDAALGSREIRIADAFENESYVESPFMLMYHVNAGFPIVQKGASIYIPTETVTCMNSQAKLEKDCWNFVSDPVDGGVECVYLHKVRHDDSGQCHCAIYHPQEKLGLAISFSADTLPYLVEWRCMASGDYVVGLQPSNCFAAGRQTELDRGTLRTLAPFGKALTSLTIRVLDGDEDMNDFQERMGACRNVRA